jgi:hypothetical protein
MADVWGSDPVHPLPHGFRLLVDMFEAEIENLQGVQEESWKQPPVASQEVEACSEAGLDLPAVLQRRQERERRLSWRSRRQRPSALQRSRRPHWRRIPRLQKPRILQLKFHGAFFRIFFM